MKKSIKVNSLIVSMLLLALAGCSSSDNRAQSGYFSHFNSADRWNNMPQPSKQASDNELE